MLSPEPLRPGTLLLGRYVLAEHLGVGLGGETWRAVPANGGAPVAVKVMFGDADWRAHRDILNEAAFLRELDHPNIVRYLGMVDLPGGATFLITEYVAGGNLWTWTRGRELCGVADTAELLLQIANGLTVVHGRGILHRDLKPQNVLVCPVAGELPRLLVADFGISRRASVGQAAITKVAGTPGYCAPEAWGGGTVTAAVDIYALGAIAWFLLTRADPEPRIGTTHLDVEELRLLLPDPEAGELVALVGAMLSLSPGSRPALPEVMTRLSAIARRPALPAFGAARTRSLPPPPFFPGAAPPGGGATLIPDTPEPASPPRATLGAHTAVAGLAAVLSGLLCAGPTWWAFRESADAPGTSPDVPPASTPPAPGLAPAVQTPAAARPEMAPSPSVHEAPAPAVPVAKVAAPSGGVRGGAPAQSGSTVAAATASATAPSHPIGRLRVGIDAPNGLPADVVLSVTAGGVHNESRSTQVVLVGPSSGTATVEVRSATRTLGRAAVDVPGGEEVKVLCRSPGADFAGMSCVVLQ